MTSDIKVSAVHSASLYWFLIFAVLFSIQVLPRLSQDSPVGDENSDIVDGYYYWKGDVISNPQHPPLAKALQALPLWTLGLHSQSGLRFSKSEIRDAYFLSVLNRDHLTDILESTRLVSCLFGLALGFVLFRWVRYESVPFVATVLTLWAFEPALLAFSGFAMADLPVTFFFFIALLRFQKLIQNPSPFQAVAVGLLSGMAITVKFTALLLIPVFLILETLVWLRTKPAWGAVAQRWLWGSGAAFLWVCLVYLPGTLAIPGHPGPFSFLFEGFHSIPDAFSASYYFRGILSHQTHWNYYPAAFVLKSPLTFLFLFGLSIILIFSRKIKIPAWQWISPLIFLIPFFSHYDMGLRMILPIYPFCILMAARAGEWLAVQKKQRILPLLWGGLLLFQILSVGLRFPVQAGYFNELVSPDRRLYWLGDSNLDFGQDTQRLATAAQAHGWSHVKLAYFGTINPRIYGLHWSYWTQRDLQGPQSGWVYAVNDAFIQLGPAYLSDAAAIQKSWILKSPPTGRIADTWYYFEVPGKIQPDISSRLSSAPVFVDDPKAFSAK